MRVKPLTEHHLEFLSLKEGCTGSSETTCTLVKMPHCWKSHVAAHMLTIEMLHVNRIKQERRVVHKIFSRARVNRISIRLLAHRIRISEILPWVRKSILSYPCYLTQAFMWGLNTLVVLELRHMVVKWRHSHLGVLRNFWELFLKNKMRYLMVSKKKNPLFGWG